MSVATAGLLLAAGGGTRYGRPKALVRDAGGRSWVAERHAALAGGGCAPVLVVVGAQADAVTRLVPPGAVVVPAPGWREGMGASLRAGLAALQRLDPVPAAVVVALVDTPGLTAGAVARLRGLAGPPVLARAGYHGRPGHPVLLGRDHWRAAAALATGDRGARDYLRGRDVTLVECADVAAGEDVDTPGEEPPARGDGTRRPPPPPPPPPPP